MEISYNGFLDRVKTEILDYMPEHYKEHKVRINTIDILEQKVDLMVLLHPSTLTAPGLNMRDYFREFLSCWDMDKILKRIAEDYIEQDRDVIMEEKEEMLWASNMLLPEKMVLSDVIFEYTQKDRTLKPAWEQDRNRKSRDFER